MTAHEYHHLVSLIHGLNSQTESDTIILAVQAALLALLIVYVVMVTTSAPRR